MSPSPRQQQQPQPHIPPRRCAPGGPSPPRSPRGSPRRPCPRRRAPRPRRAACSSGRAPTRGPAARWPRPPRRAGPFFGGGDDVLVLNRRVLIGGVGINGCLDRPIQVIHTRGTKATYRLPLLARVNRLPRRRVAQEEAALSQQRLAVALALSTPIYVWMAASTTTQTLKPPAHNHINTHHQPHTSVKNNSSAPAATLSPLLPRAVAPGSGPPAAVGAGGWLLAAAAATAAAESGWK